MKKIISLLLTGLLCLGLLTGCGQNGAFVGLPVQSGTGMATKPDEQPLQMYVYSCKPLPVDLAGSVENITGQAIQGENLYIVGRITQENGPFGSVLLRMGTDGSGLTRLPLTLYPVDASAGESAIAGIAAAPDGTLCLLQVVTNYGTEAAGWQDSGRVYYIDRIDGDGNLLSSTLLDLPDATGWISGQSMVCTPDGTVWLTQNSKQLISVTPQGKCRAVSPQQEGYVEHLAVLADGSLLIAFTQYDQAGKATTVNARWDAEADDLGRQLAFPVQHAAAMRVTDAAGKLYLYDAWGIYAYDEKTGTAPMLCSWLDSDIDYGRGVQNILALADGSFLTVGFDESWSVPVLCVLNWVDPATLPQKTVLTLAASYTSGLRESVMAFNRASQTTRIALRDYSSTPNGDAVTAAAQLNSDIINGNVPDILLVDENLPFHQYQKKGLFIDLYPLLDADPQYRREDLLANVLTACEYEGQLTSLVPAFTVRTVVAPAALVGTEPGWSWQQFAAVLDAAPDTMTQALMLSGRSDVLAAALQLGAGQFVDHTAGTAAFDSPAFCLLLQHMAAYPQPYTYADDPYGDYLPAQRIAERVNLMSEMIVRDPGDMRTAAWQMGEPFTFKGMPTASGTGGSAIVPVLRFAISRNCADPDAAWQFLRTFLTPESQTTGGGSLPLTRQSLQERLDYALAGAADPDGRWELAPLTEEEGRQIMALITDTDTLLLRDLPLQDIVLEEAEAYFAGIKTAEETALVVQDRVSTYLAETR